VFSALEVFTTMRHINRRFTYFLAEIVTERKIPCATFTTSPAGPIYNHVDSSWRQAKKGTPEDDAAQNIPERLRRGSESDGRKLLMLQRTG